MSYKIYIDNEAYEESSNFDEAKHLYETIDETCLSDYYGHEKKLLDNDGKEIAKGTIEKPNMSYLADDEARQLAVVDDNYLVIVKPYVDGGDMEDFHGKIIRVGLICEEGEVFTDRWDDSYNVKIFADRKEYWNKVKANL